MQRLWDRISTLLNDEPAQWVPENNLKSVALGGGGKLAFVYCLPPLKSNWIKVSR